MSRQLLEAVIKDHIKILADAIALSARHRGNLGGLPDMIVTLTLWLKSGRNDFREWDKLCQQASDEWMAWYERCHAAAEGEARG